MAYFLMFLTYGTHLPGDERGTLDRHLGPLTAPEPVLEKFAARLMTEPAFRLEDSEDRRTVLETIIALCRRREWRLIALHVRPTHVHGLVQAERISPGRIVGDWKANTSQVLKRHWPDRQRFWARGAYTRSVKDSLHDVMAYILDGQGEPMEIYTARTEP